MTDDLYGPGSGIKLASAYLNGLDVSYIGDIDIEGNAESFTIKVSFNKPYPPFMED